SARGLGRRSGTLPRHGAGIPEGVIAAPKRCYSGTARRAGPGLQTQLYEFLDSGLLAAARAPERDGLSSVMTGLVSGIHVFGRCTEEDVDGPGQPGQEGGGRGKHAPPVASVG